MDSEALEDPSTTTSTGHWCFEDDEDEQGKLFDTYNELHEDHIKSKWAKKQSLESLEERRKRVEHT